MNKKIKEKEYKIFLNRLILEYIKYMTTNANSKILKLEIKMTVHDKKNNKLKDTICTDSNILFFLKIEQIKYKQAMKVEASKYLKILS